MTTSSSHINKACYNGNRLHLNLRKVGKFHYVCGSKSRSIIPKLNSDLALWLGLIWGDGWIVSRKVASENYHWRIGLSEGNLELINLFVNLTNKIFGVKVNVHDRKTKFEAYFNNRIVYELLNIEYGLPDGEKIGRLYIPQIIKSENLVLQFLKGVFSTDGKFVVSKGYPRIGVDSATLRFIEDIRVALNENGFNPRVYTWNRKEGNKLYGISLNGFKQIKLFYEKIGFVGGKANKLASFLSIMSRVVPSKDGKKSCGI